MKKNKLMRGHTQDVRGNEHTGNNCIIINCKNKRQYDSDICTKHLKNRLGAIV